MILPEKFQDEIQRLQLDAFTAGGWLSSRQVVNAIYAWIATSDPISVVYGVGELVNLQWFGGDRRDEFLCVICFIYKSIPASDQ
jgi:hypothetical protein